MSGGRFASPLSQVAQTSSHNLDSGSSKICVSVMSALIAFRRSLNILIPPRPFFFFFFLLLFFFFFSSFSSAAFSFLRRWISFLNASLTPVGIKLSFSIDFHFAVSHSNGHDCFASDKLDQIIWLAKFKF